MNNSKTALKNYIIKPSVVDVLSTLGDIAFGAFFIIICVVFFNKKYAFFIIPLMYLLFRLYIFQVVDLLFAKKIICTAEKKFYVKMYGFRWKINKEQCYLMIDEMFIPSTVSTKDAVLMLYRNSTSFWSKLFKNKIKLHSIDNDNFEQIRSEAKTISALFEIPFRDIYKYR